MTKKQREDFIKKIPKHVIENGCTCMLKAMGYTELNQENREDIEFDTELTIRMATEVLLDIGATIKWPEKSKPKRKIVK